MAPISTKFTLSPQIGFASEGLIYEEVELIFAIYFLGEQVFV